MALTLIKEDGTGKADANSYADVTDGDAYHDGHLYATAWTGATADSKAAALVMATRLIDSQFQFNGGRTSASPGFAVAAHGVPRSGQGIGGRVRVAADPLELRGLQCGAACRRAGDLRNGAGAPGCGPDGVATRRGHRLGSDHTCHPCGQRDGEFKRHVGHEVQQG